MPNILLQLVIVLTSFVNALLLRNNLTHIVDCHDLVPIYIFYVALYCCGPIMFLALFRVMDLTSETLNILVLLGTVTLLNQITIYLILKNIQ